MAQIDKETFDELMGQVGKPARYAGGEWNSVRKDWDTTRVRLALLFPDVYEVGMSNLAIQILYAIANGMTGTLAERCFAPWVDMEAQLRSRGLPLFSLESRRSLRDFDLVGISLPYELTFTNVLNVLDLAGITLRSTERAPDEPLVVGGGSGVYNPEPVADFFDLFIIGEGEQALPELLELYRLWCTDAGCDLSAERAGSAFRSADERRAFLLEAARLDGVYVPAFYRVRYRTDGPVEAVEPALPGVPARVSRRLVENLRAHEGPVQPVVPFLDPVHDRAMLEIQRGCARGCRFCQAGMIYRPVRERAAADVVGTVEELVNRTGYEELGLLSLSSSDHSEIGCLVRALADRYREQGLALSLPSLRIDSFSVELARTIEQRRKTGFTFAPEAGTQRLRDVINKGVTEDDLLTVADAVFHAGWRRVKLYFMIGLPTETVEDVAGIADLVLKVRALGRQVHGKRVAVSVSVATFVPKPQTPLQWVGQEAEESLREKQRLLQQRLRIPGVELSWHEYAGSFLEAVLARGDRRLSAAVEEAWRSGCRFDSWHEHFAPQRWHAAFAALGIDPHFYATRERPLDEVLPWDHISSGVSRSFLQREYRRALAGELTPDCHVDGVCSACGVCPEYGIEVQSSKFEVQSSELGGGELGTRNPEPGTAHGELGTRNSEPGSRLRIRFARDEELQFVGHLDLIRVWERALRRAAVAVAYSHGFNPRPRIVFASPLAMGTLGANELVDIFLERADDVSQVATRLAAQLPLGLRVLAVDEVPLNEPSLPSRLRAAQFEVEMTCPADAEALAARVESMLRSESLPREQVRQNATRAYDLRPLIHGLQLLEAGDGRCRIAMTLRADGTASGRPEEVIAELGAPGRILRIVRRGLVFADLAAAV